MRSCLIGIGLLLFTPIFTCFGLMGWFGSGDICSGTGSGSAHFTRLCSGGAVYISAFACLNIAMLLLSLFLLSRDKVSRLSYAVVTIFVIYGLWVILCPNAIWDSRFFTDRNYPLGVNPNCLDCPTVPYPPPS